MYPPEQIELPRTVGRWRPVLFAIDPKTGEIDPVNRFNIPGLEALKTADLMIIATRPMPR